MQSFEPNKKALYNSGGCVACADVVISADKNHNGNVNCPGENAFLLCAVRWELQQRACMIADVRWR